MARGLPVTRHHQIKYVEFPSADLRQTKAFFMSTFGWRFTDYGPDYTAFEGAGLEGGFFTSDQSSKSANGSALVVFYSDNIEESQAIVEKNGGTIVTPIFAFPGGRRLHFTEPMGNEFAIWSEV